MTVSGWHVSLDQAEEVGRALRTMLGEPRQSWVVGREVNEDPEFTRGLVAFHSDEPQSDA